MNSSTPTPLSLNPNDRVWVTGHRGMLGSALMRRLAPHAPTVLTAPHSELDLRNRESVFAWVGQHRPNVVLHAAAKVGGIYANSTLPVDFLSDNLLIATNVIDAAHAHGVDRLVFVASNCTYPAVTQQPIPEEAQLTGALDTSIRAYGISKIAGIELCRAYRIQHGRRYISVIPPNLYGPNDNYHPEHSHVVAGLIRRAHFAKIAGDERFVVWGDGTPYRELLHVDDLADAIIHLCGVTDPLDLYNIGVGKDIRISDLAKMVASTVGFDGLIYYDTSKPNGTLRKLLDNRRIISTGWKPAVDLVAGLRGAYLDFLGRQEHSGVSNGARG